MERRKKEGTRDGIKGWRGERGRDGRRGRELLHVIIM
jgi:hypothetical protein